MSGEKIPDDVMKAAAGLAEALIAALQDGVCGCPECHMVASEHIARAIMAERAAERERCAKVADDAGGTFSNSRDMMQAVQEAAADAKCIEIAAAIRGEG